MRKLSVLICLVLSLSGCVHYRPSAVSSGSVNGKTEIPVGIVTGTSSAYYIFGIGPTGDDSLSAAIADAKSYVQSDTITNVFVDRRLVCFPLCSFPLVMRIDTMVHGTLIKYVKEDGSSMLAQPSVMPGDGSFLEAKGQPLAGFFEGLKDKGTLRVVFRGNSSGLKAGVDGRYEYLWSDRNGCLRLKLIGGGDSQGTYCLNDIEKLEIVED